MTSASVQVLHWQQNILLLSYEAFFFNQNLPLSYCIFSTSFCQCFAPVTPLIAQSVSHFPFHLTNLNFTMELSAVGKEKVAREKLYTEHKFAPPPFFFLFSLAFRFPLPDYTSWVFTMGTQFYLLSTSFGCCRLPRVTHFVIHSALYYFAEITFHNRVFNFHNGNLSTHLVFVSL